MIKTLSQFVHWLNSMTTTELINAFPNTFHLPLAGDGKQSTVTKILANDAILWKLVKEYNKDHAPKYCDQCGEPIGKNHKAWCLSNPSN